MFQGSWHIYLTPPSYDVFCFKGTLSIFEVVRGNGVTLWISWSSLECFVFVLFLMSSVLALPASNLFPLLQERFCLWTLECLCICGKYPWGIPCLLCSQVWLWGRYCCLTSSYTCMSEWVMRHWFLILSLRDNSLMYPISSSWILWGWAEGRIERVFLSWLFQAGRNEPETPL